MTHDPLCPVQPERMGGAATDPMVKGVRYEPSVPCQCRLIAQVRVDQDRRHAAANQKEDDRKSDRDRIAREILDSETFMWLMAGSEREQYYLQQLRRAYLSYCMDFDGGYGRWAERQRKKPWLGETPEEKS